MLISTMNWKDLQRHNDNRWLNKQSQCCEQSDGVPCLHCGAFHLFCSNQHSSWHHQSATRSKQKVSQNLPLPASLLLACCQWWFIKQVEGYYVLAPMDPLLSVHITAKWQTPAHRPHWLVLTDAEGSLPAPAPPSPWAGVWYCLSFSLVLIPCLWPGCE